MLMEIIEPVTHVEICRDPDDNNFWNVQKILMSYILSAEIRIFIKLKIREYFSQQRERIFSNF